MPALRRDNVQGLIVASYQTPCSRHLLFEVTDADGARSFLRDLIPKITRASQDLSERPEPLINVGLSYGGLDKLVAERRKLDGFPTSFKAPPNTEVMGDVGKSGKGNWWNRHFTTDRIHLDVILHCWSLTALDSATADIRSAAEAAGLQELRPGRDNSPLTGQCNKDNPRELHFGYLDGFSQPQVNWDDEEGRPDLLDRRHFLLGDPRGDTSSLPREAPWVDLAMDGSYGVLRWIYQDVAAFEQFLTEAGPKVAPDLPLAEARELVAAKMMGRWRDGTPLVLSPDAMAPHLAGESFAYKDDPDGLKCPLTAHIRIANHRDDPLTVVNAATFKDWTPQILRRGHSYGPKLQGDQDDGVDRGVIGLFFCADINTQFYSLTRWMRRTNFHKDWPPDALNRQDPIVGLRDVPGADASFTIPVLEDGERKEVTLKKLPDFVRTQGTLFLLMPGIEALERIADARAWP